VAKARYIIGIDLGTTNTAVAYVDTRSAEQRVSLFEVPQLVAPGQVEHRRQLPSFIYMAGEHDLGPTETALPWDDRRRIVVGELARSQGARVASRMVASAKSWLCHSGVDRHAPILPWGSEEGQKLSPVAAAAMLLRHIQEAWDFAHEDEDDAEFAEQEVIVTVPASFDEAARELTLAAATSAGLDGIRLLEEPQAAFYAWIDSHPARARKELLASGNRVLVFDVGGGTTDFTLITVGEDGDSFDRTAVGDHLLLGGDNIDLTLAKLIEGRLGKKLDLLQWHGLVHACRLAKERILSDGEVGSVPITVAGRGSKLIGGTLKDQLERGEVEHIILEGFFPQASAGETPKKVRSGLQEFGLPYAQDAAITRHLAEFLSRQHVAMVDAILFNGGAMTPASLRARVIEQIGAWQERPPVELANDLPELAVAKGAAYYGLVRRGFGARIRGGTPRAFYVGVGAARGSDQGDMAVCLAPKGLEDGSTVELDREFELVTNRPVSFKLYSSSSRQDQPGTLVPVGDGLADMSDDDSDLLELPPIVTVLRAPGRSRAKVHLEVHISELGALEIYCISTDGDNTDERWRLAFDMRGGGASSEGENVTSELDPKVKEAQELVRQTFSASSTDGPKRLTKKLEEVLGARRDDWSMTVARALFDAAFEIEEARKQSAEHEARWLHLTGFCLRPGSGAPLDAWRVKQMWRIFNDGIANEKAEQVRLAWWITWRRIAGGLSKGQQEQIFDRLAQLFLPSKYQKKKWHQAKPSKQEAAEMWRTLANLERIDRESKAALGDELARRLETKKGLAEPLYFWALGRIGTRAPLYGPLNTVVPAQRAARWLDQLLAAEWPEPDKAAFPMAQLGRRTGDRSRDLDDDLRGRLVERLKGIEGGERTAMLVEKVVELEAREERVLLGDSLPAGLRLVPDEPNEAESQA